MVAEAAVVRVFHHSHQLHAGVAEVLDPGQDTISEVCVAGDLGLRGRDPDVSLVDADPPRLAWTRVLPGVWLLGGPVQRFVISALAELHGVLGPGGEAPEGVAVLCLDPQLVLAHVRDHWLASLGGQVKTEVAKVVSSAHVTAFIPAVEVPHQGDGLKRGGEEEERRGGGGRRGEEEEGRKSEQ